MSGTGAFPNIEKSATFRVRTGYRAGDREREVWEKAASGELDAPGVRQTLREAHDDGARLSPRSLACLPMEDPEQLATHVSRCKALPADIDTVVTCVVPNRRVGISPKTSTACSGAPPLHAAHKAFAP